MMTSNIHEEQLWRLRDHFARDGMLDAEERALLAEQERLADLTNAAAGILLRGRPGRRLRRAHPELLPTPDQAA